VFVEYLHPGGEHNPINRSRFSRNVEKIFMYLVWFQTRIFNAATNPVHVRRTPESGRSRYRHYPGIKAGGDILIDLLCVAESTIRSYTISLVELFSVLLAP